MLRIEVFEMKPITNRKMVALAIICIAVLEVIALLKGFNGQLLRWVIASILFVVGVTIPQPKMLKK